MLVGGHCTDLSGDFDPAFLLNNLLSTLPFLPDLPGGLELLLGVVLGLAMRGATVVIPVSRKRVVSRRRKVSHRSIGSLGFKEIAHHHSSTGCVFAH